jgi:hypothetical protein
MSAIDYDVDNYSISELLAILGLTFDFNLSSDTITQSQITDINTQVQTSVNRYKRQFIAQPQLVLFFQNIQNKVTQYTSQLSNEIDNENDLEPEYVPNDEQTNDWLSNQYLTQDDPIQTDKITDRNQKVNLYDNMHFPMKQEQIGVNNNFAIDVAQDSLNPNLKNITNRFITLDSRNRLDAYTSTDYTADLSEHVTNVLSLRLYAISIPYTWYTIDYHYGNTCLWITNLGSTFKISLDPGNYTPVTFCVALNAVFLNGPIFITSTNAFATTFFTNPSGTAPNIVTYNSSNSKITFSFAGYKDPGGHDITPIASDATFDSSINPYIQFYDFNGELNCFNGQGCNSSSSFDGSLGWLMGYRLPVVALFVGGNVAPVAIDLFGPKYFTIVLDDFNQNHINNGLITNVVTSNAISMPSYYNTSQPYICSPIINPLSINALAGLTSIAEVEAGLINANMEVLPSAPRTLTNAQIYTINEIIKNKSKNTSNKGKATTNSDTFAILYIKYPLTAAGIAVDFSGQLQDNKRNYFGPVDIDRLRVRLVDDRGYIVNLNGSEWSCSIICETLYQY